MKKLKVLYLAPFNLEQLTGTPIRSNFTIKTGSRFSKTFVVSSYPYMQSTFVSPKLPGIPSIVSFWLLALKKGFEIKPDVIHCFTQLAFLPAIIYKTIRNAKVIIEVHGIYDYEEQSYLLGKFADLLIWLGVRIAHKIIAMSTGMKKVLINRFGARYDKINVLWGPLDVKIIKYEPMQPKYKRIICYFGNDKSWQGFDVLLKAISIVCKEAKKRYEFYMLGPPKEKYQNRGLPNTRFFGKVSDATAQSILPTCDVFLSSRRGGKVSQSQYPHKLSYYLAYGRPIIGTDTSDQKIVISKAKCGSIVTPNDQRALAREITNYINADFKILQKQGRNARRFAERNLSQERYIQHLKECYE